ncbi:MAG TPA: LamG-like jellyroll fold domain-containing protein, partial [Pyrinomonadaceae bacterium]|nr:LamG-like jellyroll fold domain-containing protein [Pyrinomonadaceae bacterium]
MIRQKYCSFLISLILLSQFQIAAWAQVCTPPPTGLVAWYKAEGNANDSSGTGNHGTLGTASISSGHVGQAFNFTAQNESVVLPNNASMFPLTSLSIEGWIRPLDYAGCSGTYRIFHTVQFSPLRGYATFINCPTQKLIGALFDSAGTTEAVVSNASTPTGTFSHFAMTWDGASLKMYVNGVLDNT